MDEWDSTAVQLFARNRVSFIAVVNAEHAAKGNVLFADQVGQTAVSKIINSKIWHGGLHLQRLTPFKDVLVPSGPLAGISGTVFNLFNSTFGAGMLGFGIVYLQLGLVLATFLSVFVVCAQAVSNYLVSLFLFLSFDFLT
jgi:hypothetical protein